MNNYPSKILVCDKGGQPQRWATIRQAIIHICSGEISYSEGECITIRGGYNSNGTQSIIEVPAIIWLNNMTYKRKKSALVTRNMLFKRDKYRCIYCGHTYSDQKLSQDHIIPKSRGGRNDWLNLATCCKHCNSWKGNRTPKEAKLELYFQPRIPSPYELLYLSNHSKITGSQYNYLLQFTNGVL